MLYVYLSEEEVEKSGLEVVRNPADLFELMGLKDTQESRDIIKNIEKGSYLSSSSFLTRFGEKIPITFMSTGTKVVLLTTMIHDKIIDLRECGINARDYIISHIDNAHVLMYAKSYGIAYEDDTQKEFLCNGYHFESLAGLADYIYHDYPDEPE